jgi:hypothetical protein
MSQRQFRSDDTSKWIYGYGDGSDGVLSISADTTEAPIDSACTGTATQTTLSATNAGFATAGQILLIIQSRGTGTGLWELNTISSYVAGTITLGSALINSYGTGAQVRVLKQYSSVTVDNTKTYTAKAWDGTVGGIIGWFCSGTTTITGTVLADGKGYRGGGGADLGSIGYRGEGTAGDNGTQQVTANGNGGGAGDGDNGAGYGAGGGGGGNIANGTVGTAEGTATPGAYGGSASNASLTTLIFGGGGGGGSRSGSGSAQTGGTGGGIIFVASLTITVTGKFTSIGTAGVASGDAGGGGGAGGSVLLKCINGTLSTTSVATAGAGGSAGGAGGAGSAGAFHIDYLVSETGTTNPTLNATQDGELDYMGGGAFIYNLL